MKKLYTIIMLALLLAGFAIYEYLESDKVDRQIIASQLISETMNTSETVGIIKDAAKNANDFKPKPGEQTIALELPNIADNTVTFAGTNKGKLQFVNFWASWCGPCELEAPDLQKIHEVYEDKLEMYGVNVTNDDKERQARAFVEQYGFTFEVLFDRTGEISSLYKIHSLPTSFLLDEDGVILERINGVITYEQWEEIIESYINKM